MNLDYLNYTLTVEVDRADNTKHELGVITAQLPIGMTGTEVLTGLAAMLDAAAKKLDAEACYPRLSIPPGMAVSAVPTTHSRSRLR